ncbi:MAG: Glycosyltransferase AglD [Methanonatronarchaeales archaeon]|nr:Glycosyltransferase AglD [Methanonatronarchaeales archaeon]
MAEVSVVIPAYREGRLGSTVKELLDVLGELDVEILIVTDHPGDATTMEARALSREPVNHIELPESVGKGGAVLRGFREAEGDVLGFVDADGSVSPEDIPGLVKAAGETGGAVASRNVASANVTRDRSLARRAASRAFNVFVRLLFDVPFRDTQCGAKFFRGEPLREVLPEMRCTGFEFDVQLLWRLRNRGLDVEEVPVTWKHSGESVFSLAEGPSMLFNLTLLRLRGKT